MEEKKEACVNEPPARKSSFNSNNNDNSFHNNDIEQEEFLSRENVEHWMREQDAELLESGPNISPTTSSIHSPVRVENNMLSEEAPTAAAAHLSPVCVDVSLVQSDLARRALSGVVWIQKDDEDDDNDVKHQETLTSQSAASKRDCRQDDENSNNNIKRNESMDRRLSEVAQFAEAVWDLTEQDKIRIIGEVVDDDDDDDDDDDATEIRVEPPAADIASGARDSRISMGKEVPVQKKTRPQWPFGPRGTKGIFLDQLPEPGTGTQDYVYKGIQCNPPEIVKRGTTRGNYALLHRKAWLEVSDLYHRYGKNLRLYYRYWERLGCPTNMFFDWLDSKGEAAGNPLPELDECPRSELDSDTVLYITNPDVTNGYAIKFVPDERGRGRAVDVDGDPVRTGPDGWIFVLRDNAIYGAQKITSLSGHSKQRFHHSSFFGGKAVAAAGIFITDEDGVLTRLYPHSGHYRPGEAHMQRVLFYLHHAGVDLRTFDMDMQQILHVARDKEPKDAMSANGQEKAAEKKKKVESLYLVPAVLGACFLAHKARFIGNGIFARIHQIRKENVASVSEALAIINY